MSEKRSDPVNPYGTAQGNPEGGIKFMGKAPPAFLKALKDVRTVGEEEKKIIEEGKSPKPRAAGSGSDQLEKILQKLDGHSYTFEEIILPSKGVFYNGTDGPVEGKLDVRPMTGSEEQILATPKFVKKGTAMNMIFQRCMKQNFKTDEFLSIDRSYLVIFLRIISYGNKYDVDIKCGECGRKFGHSVDLNTLMVDACPDNFRPPLTDVLPKSQLKFSWRLSKGTDDNMVIDYRERQFKQFGENGTDDSLLYKMSLMIEEIEDIRHKTEILILLKKLPVQDIAYLKELALDPPFGVDTEVHLNCPFCYNEFDMELPIEASFFFPRQRRKNQENP